MNTAKVLREGNRQTIIIPSEFSFPGDEVYIKKVGDVVVLIPREKFWESWWEGLSLFTEDFMDNREQPPLEIREELFET
ncbi:MAG: AbrB/MazE/SpoVT family DNA-binding domain-containing protein [Hormoscilla sp. SP5CHS1]|nr:AbrB/MazE/SpoVT family DNA-binding domain-containing protein [Hormoscilla sp. SP5CHS1]